MKRTIVALALLGLLGYGPVRGGDLALSDPSNVKPPPSGAIGFPSRELNLDALPGFKKPPPGYGEVGFYWWLGDPLTKERLAWQLDRLAGKGVMGLQINYAHGDRGGLFWGLTYPSDPPLFSEAWWELVGWFLQEAKSRGMAVSLSDYTLGIGQGWSVDEVIDENPDIAGSVLLSQSKQSNGGNIEWRLPAGTLMVAAYDPDSGAAIDLRGQVVDGVLTWQSPTQPHRIMAVYAKTVRPSIDPMNPKSGPAYAKKFFGQFEDRIPGEAGGGLNFFFSDELALGVKGNLWTARFAEEFRKRKGYDIVPELPALFHDIGPRTPKIRLDYRDVMVSLSEEAYFKPIFDWHQERGMIYGCDHGGRGRDVVEFGDYFRTQRWNQGPGCDQPYLRRDLIKNKVAASIAHLYQRPRVWLEGYHSSGWGTSSEQITDATFANFAQGHNLLTLHGLYYSTHGGWWEWAPPGNHFRMPYWTHMGELMQCVERLGYLLSQGHHRCDVAIVYPVAPMEAGLGGKQSVDTAFGAGEHLYRNGIDFDFIDFESLARAEVENRELQVSGERYRVLILPAMRAVRYSTIQKALTFHRAGGVVLAIGALPEASDRAGRDDAELDAMVREIFDGVQNVFQSPSQATRRITEAFPQDFAASAGSPDFMHRKVGPRDVYMVYGVAKGTECSFRATGKVELWDPWTGQTQPLSVLEQSESVTRLRMPLGEKVPQLIVFGPGTPDLEDVRPERPVSVVPLEGDWEFELEPTMDNRWGDFHWPPTSTMIGAEARQLRYADELAPNPGWQNPQFDDSQWPKVTSSFGPKFWKLGPLPENVNATALERQLLKLEKIDPAVPVQFNGAAYRWNPYEFSWRWGIEDDPGHQGYHGLKGEVSDEFIALGRMRRKHTTSAYEKEPGGSRYYLWTSVRSDRDQPARVLLGGNKPASVWINQATVDSLPGKVRLKSGSNPMLLRYDSVGHGFVVLDTGRSDTPVGESASQPVGLSMTWHHNPGILPFDTRPQTEQPAGWYRFTSPPGLRGMTITARGTVRAWADGKELQVEKLQARDRWQATVAEPAADCVKVALRIEQVRGSYGGAALAEPISLDCGPGTIAPGDWSQIDGLLSYSGGAWYRKTVTLSAGQTTGTVRLDLGKVAASAEVRVNGRPAGIRPAPPWTFDIAPFVKPGENRIEVLVYNTLANHYTTIPTRYRGSTVSGLLGPVRLEVSP